ncbi:MAG: hypothetical protein MMC33_002884 [Icmadophila ericetorum]|nr:hypothetical protein [Icmadophila ericetorum]
MAPTIVDVHTHMYPPSYLKLLSSRTETPYVHNPSNNAPPRLIILPSDNDVSIPLAERGRPIDDSYSSLTSKLAFMKAHSISTSVISLANPWLDFLPKETAAATARTVNDEMEALCAREPVGKLYFLGTLPLSASVEDILDEISRLAKLPHLRGLILGTTGLGSGLDDAALDPLWNAIEKEKLLVFIHPHYGLPSEVFGPRQHESGHVMPLSLGFPLETTIAFTRMYLAGVFEGFPALKILLAHAGGAIPFLSGRIESCVLHERRFVGEGNSSRRDIWDVLKRNVWLDGVIYSSVGLKAAVEVVGKERVLFGTDHPFFPPLEGDDGEGEWLSVSLNVEAVRKAFGGDERSASGVLGLNAIQLLGLGA